MLQPPRHGQTRGQHLLEEGAQRHEHRRGGRSSPALSHSPTDRAEEPSLRTKSPASPFHSSPTQLCWQSPRADRTQSLEGLLQSHTSGSFGTHGKGASLPSCRLQAPPQPGLPSSSSSRQPAKLFLETEGREEERSIARFAWGGGGGKLYQLTFKYPFGSIFSLQGDTFGFLIVLSAHEHKPPTQTGHHHYNHRSILPSPQGLSGETFLRTFPHRQRTPTSPGVGSQPSNYSN